MHAEVELRVERLSWHGFVDLINLSDKTCELIDFKTGEFKPDHEFQILVIIFYGRAITISTQHQDQSADYCVIL